MRSPPTTNPARATFLPFIECFSGHKSYSDLLQWVRPKRPGRSEEVSSVGKDEEPETAAVNVEKPLPPYPVGEGNDPSREACCNPS